MPFTYILASDSKVLYIGVTNDLRRRLWEHRQGREGAFTSKYRVHRLVWYEASAEMRSAIALEKRLKGWRRERKIALIEESNPGWHDLAVGWFERET